MTRDGISKIWAIRGAIGVSLKIASLQHPLSKNCLKMILAKAILVSLRITTVSDDS